MKRYLVLLGAAIIVLSLVGGAIYLSVSYNEYQSRIQAVGAPAGSPLSLFDVAKWQFARVMGGAIIFGGLIYGSLLMGLGWIAKLVQDIRDSLIEDEEHSAETVVTSQSSRL